MEKNKNRKHWINSMLKQISIDYNIPIGQLDNYYQEYESGNYKKLCKAKKQDGLQCTRKCKGDNLFCGKHLNNNKNGCVPNLFIELKGFTYDNCKYYYDEYNFIYSNIETGKYKIVGRKIENNIEFI